MTMLVSIRARHHWRAIPAFARVLLQLSAFQSAPAITGGRSRVGTRGDLNFSEFQSAPAITGGRSWKTIHPNAK